MSLINDALKKAKQHQEQSAPSPDSLPHFKPVDPHEKAVRGFGLVLPGFFALLALLVLLLFWEVFQGRKQTGSDESTANTELLVRALDSAHLKAPSSAATSQPVAPNVAPPILGNPVAVPTPASLPVPQAVPKVAVTDEPTVALTATNTAAPTVVLQPEMKLQSIVFNPARPSAMIDGLPLFVGDTIRGQRVTRITARAVTLIGNSRTNVLELTH